MNEFYQIYLGYWYEVYFLCRRTGNLFATNPVYMDFTPDERQTLFASGVGATFTDAQKILYSQLDISYFNHMGRSQELWSFPDSISPNRSNQIRYEIGRRHYDAAGNLVDDDSPDSVRNNPFMTVIYNIGTDLSESGLMLAMSVDTFDHYHAELQLLVDAEVLDIPQMRIFVNNYTLLTYQDMLDGITDFCPIIYRERYPALPEMGQVYMLKPISNRTTNDLLMLYGLLEIGPDELKAEEDIMGRVTPGGNNAFFRIPLTYELDGSSILMYVNTEDIHQSEGFTLDRININRTWGATLSIDDGYLFIPDGSGAIIRNDEPVRSMSRMTLPFFGPDFGKFFSRSVDIPIDSTLPVFGTKRNDIGMFAIAEHSPALGGINVEVSGNPVYNEFGQRTSIFSGHIPYNMVYPYLMFHDYDAYSMRGVTTTRMFAQAPYETQFMVRYNILYDDWAHYPAWARYYQMYLERTGAISRATDKDNPVPLDICLIGSISKTINTFGIPWSREYPVTKFSQAEHIMGLIRQAGIENANVVYTGAMNGGVDFRSPNRVSFQSELGGLSGFNELYTSVNSQGFNLYNEVDFAQVYSRGNGLAIGVARSDTSRNLRKYTAVRTQYWPSTQTTAFWGWSALVNPLIYNSVASNFISDYRRVDSSNLYLATLGSMLSSNFNEYMEVNRSETILLTRDLLDTMRDEGFNIKLDSGNSYVLEYADSLINVSTASSNRRLISYSVPFVGMVLKGYIPFTGEAINRSGNMHKSLLEAVESGAGLNYSLIYENQLVLVETYYLDMFSVNYQIWMNEIIDTYTRLNREMGHLANVRIVNHERLGRHGEELEHIVRVTYEGTPDAPNGWYVYVNYGRTDYDTGSGIVRELDYLVVRR
jgi:hypothetical protein